ncbi:uncharacterized protein LOC135090635 [Scylla paramamosain]|uniref:uncharacterized protein LOC135090635 n=1 Tax=Scylla paramamosain TaxID=85552 RepID=UPI003083E45D
MQGYGVIVKLVTGANEDLSCSGMYLGHGIVLTHGILFVDLFKDKKAQPLIEQLSTKGYCARMKQEPNVLDSILKNVQSKIEVILPSKEHVKEVAGINYDFCASSGTKNDPLYQTGIQSQSKDYVPHSDSSGFLSAAAHIDRIIVQSGVYECLDSLMPASQGWKLLEENQNDITPDLERLIMSSFVLLTLSGNDWTNEEPDNIVITATKEIMSSFIPVQKGNFVYVESSPFGSTSPSMFLNSLSHGIICNTGPEGQEVLLTDARCITGSEGAPVFVVVSGQRRPCALVISPFCWQKGEWMGLTLLASLGPVLQTFLQSHTSSALLLPKNLSTQKSNHPTNIAAVAVESQSRNGVIDRNFMEGPLNDMSKSVVCIKCGKGWGSGVVISASPGIILTCAHVTYKAIDKKVTVVLSDDRRIQGTVIHQTQPLIMSQGDQRTLPARYSMWDLAVVVTHSPLCPALPLPLATSLPPQGVGVVMAGYGMFPSQILSTPTFSRGVISKVVTLPSSLLHLPSSETSDGGSNEGHTHGASDSDNNFIASDTSKIRTTIIIKRDPNSSDNLSHYLMKLGRTPSGTSSKSVPVPVVMQTTCSVYAGASGGPVVTLHPSYGLQVVGLVVCNMQDSNRVTFPHVNLAIPIPSIATILNTFLKTKDKTVLQYLDVECAAASHVWGLTDTSRSHL